eukprot:1484463-Prorocentrum_lima.AAC.1
MLSLVLHEFKKHKAPGPDQVPMELYQYLPREQKIELLTLLNQWYIEGSTPDHLTDAQVVLIYKKGDTNKFENYRPISLLNSLYKIYAALLKLVLEEHIEHKLDPMQYGFRARKSTGHALFCVRRIAEEGERTGNPTYMLLLDWRQAFDKVRHEALFACLQRLG